MGKKKLGNLFRSVGEFYDVLENVINEGDNTQNSGIGRLINSIGNVTDSVEDLIEEENINQNQGYDGLSYIGGMKELRKISDNNDNENN